MSDFEVGYATVMTCTGPELQLVDLEFCGDGSKIHIGKPTRRVGDDPLGAHGGLTVRQYGRIATELRIAHAGDEVRAGRGRARQHGLDTHRDIGAR